MLKINTNLICVCIAYCSTLLTQKHVLFVYKGSKVQFDMACPSARIKNVGIMDTNDLKNTVQNLQDKAQDLVNNPKVQEALDKGKEYVEKGKDWLENGDGKEYVEKGKEVVNNVKDKLEDFVEEKTDGKGIFGFGKKDD